ncbi:MAG: tRNA 2-thiocytidine biosynthesis TtcA family protein [Bacteroidales bacterium]|nr:tRNA 2-thiocytidine biosynthesis TtcA family protein [Bacteroidales bacterium]
MNEKYIERIRKKTGRALKQYRLVEDGDRVLAAVSGGKDSLVMLDTLANRRHYLPVKFELMAVHIWMKDLPENADHEFLRSFCEERNIRFRLIEAHSGIANAAGETLKKKSPCFLCSWNRRKRLFQAAAEQNCNKVAFGHHMDDALETLLMNMTYHGEYSSMPPRLKMLKGEFDIIRPLILTKAKEVEHYAEMIGISSVEPDCPYEERNKREEFREIVGKLAGKHKLAKTNLYKAMSNINRDYLPGE